MRKFKTFEELHRYALESDGVDYITFLPIIDARKVISCGHQDDPFPMYPELSSTFIDFYPDGMTEQEAIDFFTEFIKRKGKYVQVD